MKNFPRFRAAALPLAAVILAACTDRLPTDGGRSGPVPTHALAQIDCTASVRDATLTCGAAPALSGGVMGNVIVGGQHHNVRLVSRNARYDGTSAFEVDVTLQNLLGQALGTSDGSTVQGVRVFFEQQPTASVGTGEVEVDNEDGSAIILQGAATPYFSYDEILQPRGTSQSKTWRFTMPSTVSSFRFSVLVDGPVPAETGVLRWERVLGTSPVAQPLNAVWAASDRSAFAVGDAGAVVHYDGTTWTAMQSPAASRRLNGVWGAGPTQVYAVGDEGVLLRYGGNVWSALRTPDPDATLRGIHGAGSRVMAVGTRRNGSRYDAWLVSSADGGATWSEQSVAGTTNRQLNGVWISGSTIVAVGLEVNAATGRYDGLVLRSADGGGTWTTTVHPGAEYRNLRGVWVEGSTVVVVGQEQDEAGLLTRSVILRSTDGGATWSETLSTGPDSRYLSAVWGRDGVVYAVGPHAADADAKGRGLILRSTDGGATWAETLHPSSVDNRLLGVSGSAAGDSVFAVGRPGLIIVRDGSTWRNAAYNGLGDLRGAWASPTAVFAVGRMADLSAGAYDGLIARSVTGGATWVLSTSSAAGDRTLRAIAGTSGAVVAVGSQSNPATDREESVIMRSTNGGDTWTETVQAGTGDQSLAAIAADGGTMVAVGYAETAGGGAGLIMRSTDGGATWTRTTSTGFSRTLSAVCMSGSTVIAVGSQQNASTYDSEAVVLRSSNGGATWSETVISRPGDAHPYGVWFSGTTVVAVGRETNGGTGNDDALILRSADGGSTWTGSTFAGAEDRALLGVWGDAPDAVYAAGSGGTLLHFNGSAWTALASGTTAPLYGMHGLQGASSTRIFAVGNGLTILSGQR
jgi:photosystem II stability/assembly factor-like uncharacterized protein